MPRTVPVAALQNPGNIVTSALWNSGPKAMGDFYLTPPIFRCRQLNSQTFSNQIWAAIALDATADVDSEGGHSSVTNNTRYTAQVAGWYLCLGFCAFQAANAQADIYCALAKNGSLIVGTGQALQKGNTDFGAISAEGLVYLHVGDYVEVWGRQDTGANLNTWANSIDLNPVLNMIWMHS